MRKNGKKIENYLNPVMLVSIGKLSLSTLIWFARVSVNFKVFASFCIGQINQERQHKG